MKPFERKHLKETGIIPFDDEKVKYFLEKDNSNSGVVGEKLSVTEEFRGSDSFEVLCSVLGENSFRMLYRVSTGWNGKIEEKA
ncbi:hypothetical protein TNCT_664821 [Trichonephila clavata]|uniref:Uncharacterized protein n=1 Tax=Trichonephila clavata TaxID=2740835 RepID=A0A8X6G309_TRICU|nr:hypothetical protein TNCT_664821 [Trichonephila clavata]